METESMLLWGFIIVLTLVILTLVGLFVHAGLFSPIDIVTRKPDVGELFVAYKFARGPYKEAGALFTEVHTLLPKYRTIGVYYDDPRKKEASSLRYIVGLVLSEGPGGKVDPDEEALLKEKGYSFISFPVVDHAVQTSFPFNSTLSIIIAIMRVYPALSEYVDSRSLCAHPFIEIYDNDQKKIVFLAPLEKQDDFYPPEVHEEEMRQTEDEEGGAGSVSWEDSASIIRNEDSTDVESSESTGEKTPPVKEEAESVPVAAPSAVTQEARSSPGGDDSDANTGSSFEEIDEKDTKLNSEPQTPLEEKAEE